MKERLLESLTAWRWFVRSFRNGDWLWLFIAITIASASVTTITYLGDSIKQSMLQKAANNLGADLVLRSTRPIEQEWQDQAKAFDLQSKRSLNLVTMALSENPKEVFQLINLRAVESAQPLRGQITRGDELPFTSLQNGAVWVEPKLIDLMSLNERSELLLGERHFKLSGTVQSSSLINPMTQFAPQVTMLLEDLQDTRLIGPGSRVTYELALAGSQKKIEAFATYFRNRDPSFIEMISAKAPSEDLEKTLNRAWLFLDLAALSAVFVAGLSILIASRFYLNRWRSSLALLRAFGGEDRQLRRLFAWQFLWIGISSSLLGLILGVLLIQLIIPWLESLFTPYVSAPLFSPLALGFISGILVLWSFAWQAFQEAMGTSPLQVFKSVSQKTSVAHWFVSFILILVLIGMIVQLEFLLWVCLVGIALSVTFYLCATLLLSILKKSHAQTRGWLRISIAGILKQPELIKIQLISIGLVLFVLMLMTFVRQDLLNAWQQSLPDKTPNTFVVNVQPYQLDTVASLFAEQTLQPDFVPMARGRLLQRNSVDLEPSTMATQRGKRLLQREANIAVTEQLPAYNQITRQLEEEKYQGLGVSVEEEIAQLFGIQIGDKLTFNFAGATKTYQVRSFRKVNWQSFRLNFFFIVEPDPLAPLNISYISSLYIDNKQITGTLTQQMAQQASGALLIDVERIIQQIRQIMQQAASGVSALFLFTLIASIAVLFSATLASQEARIQTWLLLRTIGATNRQIRLIGLTEFILLGLLSGILAASFAQLVSFLVGYQLLETTPQFSWPLWLGTFILSIGILFAVGWFSQKPYLKMSANQLKRHLTS